MNSIPGSPHRTHHHSAFGGVDMSTGPQPVPRPGRKASTFPRIEVPTSADRKTVTCTSRPSAASFARPDLSTFAWLDGLGLKSPDSSTPHRSAENSAASRDDTPN